MKQIIRDILAKAEELGFSFNESDAHDMYLVFKKYEDKIQTNTTIMKTRKIVTEYIKPPVPSHKYDWMAYRDDYDEKDFIAYGSTELEAIANLLEMEQ